VGRVLGSLIVPAWAASAVAMTGAQRLKPLPVARRAGTPSEGRALLDVVSVISKGLRLIPSGTGLNGIARWSLAAHVYSELAARTVAFHKDAPAILAAGVLQKR
jgi:hypothetical protein